MNRSNGSCDVPHFQDKTILVTGATQGIGRATAYRFAREGANLLLLARDTEELNRIGTDLRSRFSVRCRTATVDLGDADRLRHLLPGEIETIGGLDILVCNAGIGQYGPVSHSSWEDIQRVLRVNLEGTVAVVHTALPYITRARAGSIILVSSVLGKRAVPYNASYSASKYALHGFADALRLEMKPMNIHVGVVCPARTRTRFFERMIYSIPQTKQRVVPESSADSVARAILRAVRKRRREVVVSAGGKAFTFFGTHFPRVSDHVLSAAVPKPELE